MALYKLYSLAADDHIDAATEIDAATDEDAHLQAVARLCRYTAVEIWEGTRNVGRIERSVADTEEGDRKGLGPSGRWAKSLKFFF